MCVSHCLLEDGLMRRIAQIIKRVRSESNDQISLSQIYLFRLLVALFFYFFYFFILRLESYFYFTMHKILVEILLSFSFFPRLSTNAPNKWPVIIDSTPASPPLSLFLSLPSDLFLHARCPRRHIHHLCMCVCMHVHRSHAIHNLSYNSFKCSCVCEWVSVYVCVCVLSSSCSPHCGSENQVWPCSFIFL